NAGFARNPIRKMNTKRSTTKNTKGTKKDRQKFASGQRQIRPPFSVLIFVNFVFLVVQSSILVHPKSSRQKKISNASTTTKRRRRFSRMTLSNCRHGKWNQVLASLDKTSCHWNLA